MFKRIKNLQSQTRSNFITYTMVISVFVIVQLLLQGGHVPRLIQGLLVPVSVYVILAISLNFTVGILGELSLGHAGFMCVGAFSSVFFSILVMDGNMPDMLRFALALLIGAVAGGFIGFLIGFPVLRLRGDYVALVTLAFGEIIMNIMNALHVGRDNTRFYFSLRDARGFNMGEGGEMLINGPLGVVTVPRDSSFVIGFILILITIFIVTNMMNSRAGRAIMSIRDNQIAAESIGINVTKYKLLAFSISAALAGMAGALFAHNLATLTATGRNFGFIMSVMILVMVVLGGIGNIRGSIIAAIAITLLPELLRGLADLRMLIYAIVLIVVMILNWAPAVLEFRERHGIRTYLINLKKPKEEK
jgi:branched-chain amino acid transport system permease protein